MQVDPQYCKFYAIEYQIVLILFNVGSHCPKIDPRMTHEYVPSAAHSGIFWHTKDCAKTPEIDAGEGETQPGFIRWLTMHSRMTRFFNDVFSKSLRSPPIFQIVVLRPSNI